MGARGVVWIRAPLPIFRAKYMATKAKLGARGGVSQWKHLATAGDVRRFLAWAIHSLRNGTLDRADALAFGQLGAVLLKAVSESEFDERLASIEQSLAHLTEHDQSHTPTAH
jgi:hypothetical protein